MAGDAELLRGTIKSWDDKKGFGFIEPHEKGRDVFFHIKQWTLREERPTLGRQVFYLVEETNDRKIRACLVRPLAAFKPAQPPVNLWSVAAAAAFFILVLLVFLVLKLPLEVPVAYLFSSTIAYQVYKSDKLSAKEGSNRVPEKALHFFGLFFGWPGALVAQKRFRHKTAKASFQLTFWFTVAINILIAAGYVLFRVNPSIYGF